MDTVIIRVLMQLCFFRRMEESKLLGIVQFVKFSIIGVSNLVVSYVVNVITLLLISAYQIQYDYAIANIVAFLISVLWSFYWNNRLVFHLKEKSYRALIGALLKMYVAYGFTGIILNNILSWIWIDVISLSKLIAPLINAVIGLPVNFVLNKLWAFRE